MRISTRVEWVPFRVKRPLPPQYHYKMNACWKGWKMIGLLFGFLMALTGLLITVLEMARAYSGVQNRGCEFDEVSNSTVRTLKYDYYPNHLLAVGRGISLPRYDRYRLNYPPVNYYMWPWSRPGMLFGLVLMIAGILGIISAFRRTYAIITAFLAAGLLSLLLMTYLIAYYSVAVHYYFRNETCRETSIDKTYDRTYFYYVARTLAIISLIISIIGLLLSYLAVLFASMALRICSRKKGLPYPGSVAPPYDPRTTATKFPTLPPRTGFAPGTGFYTRPPTAR